jgi:sensor histidine kinase YesM
VECTCAYSVNFKSFDTSSYSFSGLYGSLSLYRGYQTLVFNTDFVSSGMVPSRNDNLNYEIFSLHRRVIIHQECIIWYEIYMLHVHNSNI